MNLNINIKNQNIDDSFNSRSSKKLKSENSSPTFSTNNSETNSETNTPSPVGDLFIKIPIDRRKQILKKVTHKCTALCNKNCKREFQNHACGQEDCDGKCGYLSCGCIEICTEH
jgi:hypothetical protein